MEKHITLAELYSTISQPTPTPFLFPLIPLIIFFSNLCECVYEHIQLNSIPST